MEPDELVRGDRYGEPAGRHATAPASTVGDAGPALVLTVVAGVPVLVSFLLLAAYAAESREFGATYGPLTGVIALLLWANLTGIALFVGIALPHNWKPDGPGSPDGPRPTSGRRWRSGPTPRPPAAPD